MLYVTGSLYFKIIKQLRICNLYGGMSRASAIDFKELDIIFSIQPIYFVRWGMNFNTR